MRRLLIIGACCMLAACSFGQKAELICKEVNGAKSTIIDNKRIGIMDTVLFLVRGQITKRQDVEESQVLKGINVKLRDTSSGRIIAASTDEKGNFQVWGDRGTYDLEISYFELDNIVIRRLRIGSGEIRLINAILGPGTYYIMTQE